MLSRIRLASSGVAPFNYSHQRGSDRTQFSKIRITKRDHLYIQVPPFPTVSTHHYKMANTIPITPKRAAHPSCTFLAPLSAGLVDEVLGCTVGAAGAEYVAVSELPLL
jgi:hypothetical protein